MSDERDRPGAAGDGDEAGDVETAGSHGQTALAAEPVTGPLRPTGKRSRQRAAAADAVSAAIEQTAGDADAETEKIKTAGKGQRARSKGDGPSRNPIVYVINYLKEVVAELRKVIWPNRKQMITYTSVVLGFLVFMVALIAGSDYGFARLVLLVFGE